MSEVIEPKDVRIAVPSIASGMLIDGSIVGGEAFLEVINPATGLPFALAPDATRAQLEMPSPPPAAPFRPGARRRSRNAAPRSTGSQRNCASVWTRSGRS